MQFANRNLAFNETPRMVEVFCARHSHYFRLLKDRHPEVRTIFFNESFAVVAPNLVKDYYASVVSDCKFYEPLVKNTIEKCLNRPEDLEQRYPMSSVIVKETASYFSVTNNFIHIMTGACVTPDGDVIKDNFKIIPIRCQMPENYRYVYFRPEPTYARHREVFTIAQYWGRGFFHFMVEDFPRIAAYLPFLKRHPEVKVHVAKTNGFTVAYLAELGIVQSRLVSGHVEAGVLYMPGGTRCGRARLFSTQLLSLRLRGGLTGPEQPRNTVVLIQRSEKRWFDHHDDILAMIRRHATPTGLETVVYSDNPVPGIAETRRLFGRAYMVVAPHGAGLANL
ncbi:MAG: glycosyltransferase family 61 protein, partial [Chromatiales bacterium]